MYTVKQVSQLAGVSIRTLHYYDEIGLLSPSKVGANSYRYYDDASLLRLQQILFYRELGLELNPIKDLLDSPDFDTVSALKAHREALRDKAQRLSALMNTLDETIDHLERGTPMSKRKLFDPFSEEKQKEYEREIRLSYDKNLVAESQRRYASYSEAEKQAIGEEGNQIYSEIVDAIEAGLAHTSDTMQALLQRWHQHLRYFYEPPLEVLRGLGDLYTSHPDFIANFAKIHPRLGEFMQAGINVYVDALETEYLERLIEQDNHQTAEQDEAQASKAARRLQG